MFFIFLIDRLKKKEEREVTGERGVTEIMIVGKM